MILKWAPRYHRLMTSCMLAGWFAAIKSVSDRKETLDAFEDSYFISRKS